MSPAARVLIVDRWRESRDLLSSLLARHGADVLEARESAGAAQLAEDHRPDLIVVDADAEVDADGGSSMRLAATAARNDTPIVVLGTFRRHASPWPAGDFVAKPYHYGALIRKIEELLGNRA